MKRLILLLLLLTGLAIGQSNDECMDCHSDPDLTVTGDDAREISLFVDGKQFSSSIHGDLECIDCHADIAEVPHEENLAKVECATCHDDVAEEYAQSIHGKAFARGIAIAAECSDCHGKHNILSSDETASMTHPLNLPATCGDCHNKKEVIKTVGTRPVDIKEKYLHSVHGSKLLENPESGAATCTDCHGSHTILPALYADSPLNVLHINSTCGNCHQEENKEYMLSIHWQSLKRGHYEAPTCTGCHGEHGIDTPEQDNAPTSKSAQATEVCGNCHSYPAMMEKFGLQADRIKTYNKSYHGLAVLKDSPDAATCTGCHETHAIRSKHDSLASVYPTNLIKTCGNCHENVTPSFAAIDVHPSNQQVRNPIAYYVKNIYIWLIVLVIGGMILHNLLIIFHHLREKRKKERYEKRIRRFQPFEVYQHFLMFFSFTLLVLTGFSLKFPDAGWSRLLMAMGLNEPIRALIHRSAAVIMGLISIIQLFYLLFTKKGRKEIIALIPTWQDIIHLRQNLMYYLGLSKERPKFGRFDYGEKAEYLALIWGVIVMGATGLVLWFPEFFMRIFPTWAFETSEIVHYYEAWLATLAIIVWHWFFVIFHPEKYPLNLTWMDGTISEEDFKHHHPLEYEETKDKQ